MEFADKHPNIQVVGVDFCPMMPEWVAPNCRFQVDDIEKEWLWKQSFDLIHARLLSGSFGDPKTVIEQCFQHLTPGGYIELKDILFTPKSDDGTLLGVSPLCEWANDLADAARQMGRPLIGNASEYENMLIEAGFEVVNVLKHKLPTNAWPRDKTMQESGMRCTLARKVLQCRAVHAYFPYITVLARKPQTV
ncbi:S-adenosyl-L-methionine-dependent methyltransferase [Chaetomidium leptoderma]|uniref:S-adenosyl-L-methionine-dependent methyltransferase n=1 Tax=Chaetomidium leptoderma TaxID=669021 RepID=A0AAN6VBE8_9PEZI|nr:S-adenosyl-L-methionine-dependent methyltransferase [Chaetomidium leptoderma]